MGWVIFLAIVAAIVVLIVLGVKKKKRKEAEGIEELKNSGVYRLVLKIMDELEKNGYTSNGSPTLEYDYRAYGTVGCYRDKGKGQGVHIWFSLYNIGSQRHWILVSNRYGIESDNINIFVSSEPARDMPEPVAIAAKVIDDSGNGPCKRVQ